MLISPLVHQEVAQKIEKNLKIDLHPIDINDMEKGKTKYVDIEKNSLEFVGFQFTLEHIRIKSQNIQRFQTRILEKIAKEPSYNFERLLFLLPGSLNNYQKCLFRFGCFINFIINKKVLGRGEEICSVCNGVRGERVKSWMAFFMVVTDIQQIRDVDKWMRKEICKHFYKNYQIRLQKSNFKRAGLVTLEKEYYRLHKRKNCSCEESNCLTNPTIDSDKSL
ncbi:MAG: hypothetical protein EA343_18280 [Nodularia sp. (in: Bacteria)]|nr:MAG: hypothetical protein EA343_18280 [Nodularia sp. (in: cyanobacteria)]